MTTKEAIERLDALRRENQTLRYADVDGINMAISALEKQIAIPPKESDGYDADGFWRPDMLFCPTCGKPIDPFEHHCECGQHIDWSN